MMASNMLIPRDDAPMIPRDYQDAAFPAVMNWFEERSDWPLVVIPTGGGKSLCMAEMVRRALMVDSRARFLIVSHVSELLEQDAAAVMRQCPNTPVSLYSDKLGQKDLSGQVIVAGIQSIYRKAHQIQNPPPDIVLIDEVHTLPHKGEGMYRKFISDLMTINPYLKIVGYTATPFRMKGGYLHKGEGAMFGGIAYEVDILELLERGFLCPLTTPTMTTRMSTEGVKIQGGEFVVSQLQKAVNKSAITKACVDELFANAGSRKRWIVFAAGKEHCIAIAEEIYSRGVMCEILVDDTPKAERRDIVQWHKADTSDIRCLINIGVATTGYDCPAIDLIAMMCPTRSPVKYVQCVGRGMRLHKHKDDCLVMDFAGVIDYFGPVDKIRIPEKRKKKAGVAPTKFCPKCKTETHAAARKCVGCGYDFPEGDSQMNAEASNAAILSSQLVSEQYKVSTVTYYIHKKEGKPDSLRVNYLCGITKSFNEWVCFGHTGRARERACFWWRLRAGSLPPKSAKEALERKDELREPIAVWAKKVGKHYEVTGADFHDDNG